MKPKPNCGPGPGKGPGNGKPMAKRGKKGRGALEDGEGANNDLIRNLFPDGSIPDELGKLFPDGIPDGIADLLPQDPSLSGILDGLDGITGSDSGLDAFPGNGGTSNDSGGGGVAISADNSPVTAVEKVSSVGIGRGAAKTHFESLTGTGTSSRSRYVND